MRNKKAKAYRAMVGDVYADYQETGKHHKDFGVNGWHEVSDPVKLTETCSRSAYKLLKRIDS